MSSRKQSKIVTVSINIPDIKTNRTLLRIPETIDSPKEIRDHLLSLLKPTSGIMEGYVDGRQIVLQWYPDEVNEQAEKLSTIASRLIKEREYDKAVQILEKALVIKNHDVEYLYKLALIFFEQKKYNKTLLYLKKSISVCPIHFRANLLLGITLLKLRRLEPAKRYFLLSNIFNKSSVLPYLNLGAIYSINKQYKKSISMFNECIRLAPKESRAFLGLARIYTMLKDVESANANFQKVIELSPDSKIAEIAKRSLKTRPETHAGISPEPVNPLTQTGRKGVGGKQEEERVAAGVHQFLKHDYTGSLDQFRAYLSKHPMDHFVWYLLGETQLRTGNYDGAVISFRKAINLYSKRGLYYKGVGLSFYYQQKYSKAANAFKEAIQYGKNDPLCFTLLGICNMYLKRNEESEHMFKQAMKKNPNNPLALYFSAQLNIKKGDHKRAIDDLNKILGFEYAIPIKENVRKLLKSIHM